MQIKQQVVEIFKYNNSKSNINKRLRTHTRTDSRQQLNERLAAVNCGRCGWWIVEIEIEPKPNQNPHRRQHHTHARIHMYTYMYK